MLVLEHFKLISCKIRKFDENNPFCGATTKSHVHVNAKTRNKSYF